jgi:hypothetical protein
VLTRVRFSARKIGVFKLNMWFALKSYGERMYYINTRKKKREGRIKQVVRVPGYRTEMYCVSCEVRTEFIYVM